MAWSSGGAPGDDLAHAGEDERACAGQFHAQFQLAASGLDEPAQGGQVEVGLALDLDDGGLLDPQTPGDLLLGARGELAQGLEPLDLGVQFGRTLGDARVVYFYYHADCPLYLLLAYAKAQASDLTADEKKAVTARAAIIKAAADGQGDKR